MGLNWSEGLKQAGQGLDQMTNIKMQEADYIYKEMAQQNRQRFATSEREAGQDFITSERGEKETFQSSEGDKDRASRDAATQAQRDNTAAYREATLGVQRERNEGMQTDREADNTRLDTGVDQKTLESINKKIEAKEKIASDYMATEEERKQAKLELDGLRMQEEMVMSYGTKGAYAYIRADRALDAVRGSNKAEGMKRHYASVSDEERKKIDAAARGYMTNNNASRADALMNAIVDSMEGAQAPATGPTGDVASTVPEQTVTGGAGPDTLEEVKPTGTLRGTPEQKAPYQTGGGPPAPKREPKQKVDMTGPAYKKAAPVREYGKKNKAKGEAKRVERAGKGIQRWLEEGKLDDGAKSVLKRMNSRSQMEKALAEAGYTGSKVKKFLEYIYSTR